ncbi:MAG: putative metal-dependent hydrolase [Chitinophagaceae bacterium]
MDLRYPIGQFEPKPFSEKLLREWLTEIQILPQLLEQAINNLDKPQLDTPYREGGWTVQQVVHHVADSHINAYCRFKLGLTENNPTIKPYEEQLWAELSDTRDLPVNISITLLFALHARWYEVLRNISQEDLLNRTVYHPASQKTITLWNLLGMYAWHGQHHTAHITTLRERMDW